MQINPGEFYNLPSFLFFILWVAFPVWLAMRRRQGLIKFQRWDHEGEKERIGSYFELGIFLFAIPFTGFFFFVTVNFIGSYFIPGASERFRASIEITSLLMDIALILYMYFAERKIYVKRIYKQDDTNL